MIRKPGVVIVILLIAIAASARGLDEARCVVTIYRLRGEEWRLIKSEKFSPTIGEEELTSRTINLPGTRLRLYASVFPTDESLGSAKGPDSIQLAIAFSSLRLKSAFDVDNNATAETTAADFDTLRVQRTTHVDRRPIMARLECWDPKLERISGRPQK